MGRLIDADKLKALYEDSEIDIKDMMIHCSVVIQNIDDMPTVDAVPVARCKDCKYWDQVMADRGGCKDLYGFGRWWKSDDHCSYGVRKGGEQHG